MLILILPLHKIGSLQALSTPQVALCQLTTYPMERIYDLTFKGLHTPFSSKVTIAHILAEVEVGEKKSKSPRFQNYVTN